jgi:hypothetical protein
LSRRTLLHGVVVIVIAIVIIIIIIIPEEEPGELSGIELGYELDDRGLECRRWLLIFLLITASRPALGPTQPPIQWVPGALSVGVKRLGREADGSPLSSAEVKNAWFYTSTPPIRLHGVVLN